MAKKIESVQHKQAYIPGKEETGYKDANLKVRQGKKTLELPKNQAAHHGQDPELSDNV